MAASILGAVDILLQAGVIGWCPLSCTKLEIVTKVIIYCIADCSGFNCANIHRVKLRRAISITPTPSLNELTLNTFPEAHIENDKFAFDTV